jgi:hypothetical protein
MDLSRSSLLIAALVAALLLTLTYSANAQATHQNLYQAIMTPPTHATGSQWSFNSCGWHEGSCFNNSNGNALDCVFNSPNVAYMIQDTGCPWSGYHAHAWLAQNLLTHYEENRAVYPCCNYGGRLVTNNYEPNFTHKVRWWQGHFP